MSGWSTESHDLLSRFSDLIANSRSLGTWKNRLRGMGVFHDFCKATRVPGPPYDLKRVANLPGLPRAFVCYLVENLTYDAAKTAITSVNSMCLLQGASPFMKRDDVKQALEAHKRSHKQPVKRMLGVEDWMIKAIFDKWFHVASPQPAHVMLLFFLLATRMGILRAGGAGCLAWEAMLVTPRGVHAHVGATKMRQTHGRPVDLPFTPGRYSFDKVFFTWLKMCGGSTTASGHIIGTSGTVFLPLFNAAGRGKTQYAHVRYRVDLRNRGYHEFDTTKMNALLRSALVQCAGLTSKEAKLFSGHGGRIMAFNIGLSDDALDLTMAVGDWRAKKSALLYGRSGSTQRLDTASAYAVH